MDNSSCGFDRARSRPAKIFKSAKKEGYCPQTRARRLALPFFLPAALPYNEVL
jgi:hypothetical protein